MPVDDIVFISVIWNWKNLFSELSQGMHTSMVSADVKKSLLSSWELI